MEKMLGTGKVETWTYNDVDGIAYEHPAVIDVDLVIKDNTHILVEVKASVSRGDVLEFHRIEALYER